MTASNRKTGRCLICREMGHPLPKCTSDLTFESIDNENFEMKKIQSCWTTSCINSVCTLIKIPKAHPFRVFFLNANYCIDCLQLIRDMDFTLKQLKNFQRQILGFRQDLFAKLGDNYEAVPDNSKLASMSQKNQGLSNNEKRRFSFDEVVKMVYEKMYKDSESWTCTDFIEMEGGDPYKNIRIRNVLDLCDEGESDNGDEFSECNNQEDDSVEVKSRVLRRRSKVNYKEMDRNGEESNSRNDPKKAEKITNDDQIKNMVDENEMDLNEDNDPDWRCSDAESLGSWEGDNEIDPELRSDVQPSSSKKLPGRRREFLCSEENCIQGFDLEASLVAHKRRVHEGDSKPYHCDMCDNTYRYRKSLAAHIKRHVTGSQITFVTCLECNREVNSAGLKLHMARAHKIVRKCTFCSMNFEKQEELEEHENSHKTCDQPFQCTICDAIFTNSISLKKHTQSHDDSKPVCDVCGKRFHSAASLKAHTRIHDESFVGHSCEVCGHKFQTASVLADHMYKHSDEKKFICEVCGASFKYGKGLKLHKRKHDGYIPFVCHICGKGFIAPHYLKNHEETHSGFLSYECKVCQKMFKTNAALCQHVKIHEPKDPNRRKRIRPRFSVNIAHDAIDTEKEPDQAISVNTSRLNLVSRTKNMHSYNSRKCNERKRRYSRSSEVEMKTDKNDCEELESISWTNHQQSRSRQQDSIHSSLPISSVQAAFQTQSLTSMEAFQHQSYYSAPTLAFVISAGSEPMRNASAPSYEHQQLFNSDPGVPCPSTSSRHMSDPSHFGHR